MARTDARQFGRPLPAASTADRPTAFGVAERDGRIALVHIQKPEASYHDLPGGALDPGESEADALVREFGEETGLRVRPGALFTRADQYMLKDDGQAVNNRCAFFIAEVEGRGPRSQGRSRPHPRLVRPARGAHPPPPRRPRLGGAGWLRRGDDDSGSNRLSDLLPRARLRCSGRGAPSQRRHHAWVA
jgi:8-oxo-dGTP diphosphatase